MALSDNNKQALLVGGILGGAVFIILAYFAFQSILPEVKKYQADREKLATKLAADKKRLDGYKKELGDVEGRRKIEEAFRDVASRLPVSQDPFEVFDLLRTYFEGSDIQFTYLEPGIEKNRGKFKEYPFAVKGTARYHEFGQLINLIECNPDRLMRVTDMKMINNNKRPSIHPMEVVIATFTFNEPN